ncbi:UDP-N-acetylmuramoyl-L-alanine--D-glutamate ligase [Patescibacteria group bacterium]|nr:UDP-N-acetylmuramoyl-L-alanine--D-glutamate ligase [Patescibacteria group bacterium]
MSPKLSYLKDKTVLILGFGREGESTYNFLRKYFPKKELGIADRKVVSSSGVLGKKLIKKDKLLNFHLGEKYLDSLSSYQVVFKTPGIPFKLPEIKEAKKAGVAFASQTKLFFGLCRGKIIGVTGTKGKSTTATLIHEILQKAGFKSVLLGNIGIPALDYLDKDSKDIIFVFELSSHQLFDIKKSPNIAVILNIFPEHLDYYENFNQYREAKSNIMRYQTSRDTFIYNKDNKYLRKLAGESKAIRISFSLSQKDYGDCYVENGGIFFKKEKIMGVDEVSLKGSHNLNNIMAVINVCKSLGIASSTIKSRIKAFKSLEHRLEETRQYRGVTFVDDSISTIPESSIAAMQTYRERPTTVIIGGFDRGLDYSKLAKYISKSRSVKNVLLVGETSDRIGKILKSEKFRGKIYRMRRALMPDVVKTAFANTPKAGAVLLSPAAASFDMFEDYKERGILFKKAVNKLKE